MIIGWITASIFAIISIALALRARAERERLTDDALAYREQASLALTQAHDQHSAQLARVEREASLTRARAPIALAQDLLSGLDALEQARDHARVQGDALSGFSTGLDLAISELERALAKHQITPLRPQPDDPFDPAIHEAVQVAPAPEGVSPGHIIERLRAGWTHPSRVLRPAMVRVAQRAAPQRVPDDEPLDPPPSADPTAS
jgi:molecular chaperone GrpE